MVNRWQIVSQITMLCEWHVFLDYLNVNWQLNQESSMVERQAGGLRFEFEFFSWNLIMNEQPQWSWGNVPPRNPSVHVSWTFLHISIIFGFKWFLSNLIVLLHSMTSYVFVFEFVFASGTFYAVLSVVTVC